MTPFHVGASNQPCGIQTSQPGPGRGPPTITAAPPGPQQKLLTVSDRRLNPDVSSAGIVGILLIKLIGQAQLSSGTGTGVSQGSCSWAPSCLTVQISCLFVLVDAAGFFTDHCSIRGDRLSEKFHFSKCLLLFLWRGLSIICI